MVDPFDRCNDSRHYEEDENLGSAASKAASCITVFFSSGVLCYSTVLYARYRLDTKKEPGPAIVSRTAERTPPSFCGSCGAPVRLADGKASRFCTKCGGELACRR